jgi:hypothetical protein
MLAIRKCLESLPLHLPLLLMRVHFHVQSEAETEDSQTHEDCEVSPHFAPIDLAQIPELALNFEQGA